MSQYPNAKFITSANQVGQFLPDSGSEVAFAGRSNSGKSSAINVIVNRRQFARTSKTPGRTQLVNFFELRDQARLVDLPGYGYARVSDAVRDHWGRLLTTYIEDRSSLRGLFLITDIRRGLADYDRQLLELAESVNLPVHVLLTKADKLKRGKAVNVIWTKQAGYWKIVAFHVQPFADTTAVPDSRSQFSQERRHQPIVVDPSLVSRVEKFLDGWFIQKDKATTMSFFSKKSYDCVGLFDDASQPPVADVQERLQQDIKKISDFVGKSSSLEDVLRPADTWDPDLHLIAHEQQNAYTLTSYSDYHAEQLDCARRRKGLVIIGKHPFTRRRHRAVACGQNRQRVLVD